MEKMDFDVEGGATHNTQMTRCFSEAEVEVDMIPIF
jgi:hypothetical protein